MSLLPCWSKMKKMQIDIEGIPVEVTKKKIKSLRLTISPPDGRVRLSVPDRLTEKDIRAFLTAKLPWIQKHRSKFEGNDPPFEPAYVTGEPFFLFGKRYLLRVVSGKRGSSAVMLEGNEAILTIREGSTSEQREAAVNEWYRAMLKEKIGLLLPKWEAITGLKSTDCGIRRMKTRWGSCNTVTGKIWLNLELAKKPPEYLEYVILHELAHLRERNHGKAFWAILDRYMPDWRERREKLNAPVPKDMDADAE